ncbi:hypothetical protein [Phyllobacterium salinisoli]|uniref:hypothetical protein n=1 Tax=Phyllobacterium salinisoli TaxID=1899321 RepID=UPI0011C08019|nr:hypothetical protein [Phyllobacterium salinisoli]
MARSLGAQQVPVVSVSNGGAGAAFHRPARRVMDVSGSRRLRGGNADAGGRIGMARVRAWATLAWNDPLPGLLDLPLTVWPAITR